MFEKKNDQTIEKKCIGNMFPIPNFIDYPKVSPTDTFALGNSFTIYILEAKPGIHFDKYDLRPFDHMPNKWKNGYSKGMALSETQRTVIYWGLIW